MTNLRLPEFNPDDEGFNLFKCVAEKYNLDRYLQGFAERKFDVFTLRKMTIDLRRSADLMELEIDRINFCKESYLLSFASNDTGKFANRINILKATENASRIFTSILKKSQKQPPKRPGQDSRFDKIESTTYNSPLSADAYQTSFSSLDELPEYHNKLYETIHTCLFKVDEMMDTCQQLANEEMALRRNPQQLKVLHDDQVHDLQQLQTDFLGNTIDEIIRKYGDAPDPIYEALQKSKSIDEFLSNNYHVFNIKNMTIYAMKMMIREATKTNRLLDILEYVPQENQSNVRLVLENLPLFAEQLPLDAKETVKVARFFIWANPANISNFYEEFRKLLPDLKIVKYDYLTTVIKEQKQKHPQPVEKYCHDLNQKIEQLGAEIAQNRAEMAARTSL